MLVHQRVSIFLIQQSAVVIVPSDARPIGWHCLRNSQPVSSTEVFFNSFVQSLAIPGLVNIQKTMENHHFSWENLLFLWPFSIAMLVYQRVLWGVSQRQKNAAESIQKKGTRPGKHTENELENHHAISG